MRGFVLTVFFLLLLSCVTKNDVDVHESVLDCGMSPYRLQDSPFSRDKSIIAKVRAIKIIADSSNFESERLLLAKNSAKTISRLNSDFKSYNMSFSLEDIDIIVHKDFHDQGINKYIKHAHFYEEVGYLNIFYYDNTMGGFNGAAVDIPSISFAIKEKFSDKSTVTHEAGHCYGLYHTHSFSGEEGNSYHTGDFICKTPHADLYAKEKYGYIGHVSDDCRYIGDIRENGLTQKEHDKNIRNFMSYGLSKCRDEFIQEQIDRIRFIIANSENHKKSFKI